MTTAGWGATRSGEFLGVASLLLGAAVAVFLGVFAIFHTPSPSVPTLGFESVRSMMIWLGAAAGALALVQLLTAVTMYTRGGRVVAVVHRASGMTAVLLSLPVAYACLWSLGFADHNLRVLVHSLAGCLLYGALVTKLLALHVSRMPSWLLPVAGGLLLTGVVASVLTTSVWYFAAFGTP
jgi:Family of unknown function (DUF6529)